MEPERQQTLAQPSPVQDVFAPGSAQYDAAALDRPIQPRLQESVVFEPPAKGNARTRLLAAGIIGVVLLLISISAVLRHNRGLTQVQTGNFANLKLALSDFSDTAATVGAAGLKVNGQLEIDSSIILTPTSQPDSPESGQLYYDQTSKHLAYYDGLQFIDVAGGTSTTNITNVLNGAGNGVQLQSTSPGTQQNGNLNISGVAKVGALKTTTISSDGGTLYINPVGATTQQTIAAGTPATAGLSDIGSIAAPGPGWANDLSATKITMGNIGGTAVSISVYFTGGTGSSHVQLGLYDDDGDIPSKPGNLLATSISGNLIPNGWTTITIPNVNLTANTTYWLAVNTDDNTVGRVFNGGNKASCFISSSFGFMPNPFSPFGCFYDNAVYSVYLNYLAGAGVSGNASQAQMVVGPTGQVLFQNTSDSNIALQVQNAAGTSTVLNVDTLNGRIGIGKTTPSYKLDIAAGDINLSNGRSLRFAGLPVISVNGAGTTASISNFLPGGKISAQAESFVIQDANGGNALFSADTSARTLTVTGTPSSFATLTLDNSHFASTQSTPPTIGTPTNCGTTPTAAVTVGSTDTAGSFTITTGTGGTSSTCDTVFTFNKAYGSAPKSIIVVGKTDAASALRQPYVSAETTTDFTVQFGASTGGTNSTTYTFSYWVIE